ncbi:MAG: hypothetical protein ACI9OJ_003081 [Myxococcota bacterium]|jgi:hypothetical protein
MNSTGIITGNLTRTGSLADLLGSDLEREASIRGLRAQSPIGAAALLARLNFSGLVLLEDGDERAALHLREGRIVASGDDQYGPDESLLVQLAGQPELGRANLVRAVVHADKHGAALGRTLFTHKLAEPRTLATALRNVHRARADWFALRPALQLTAMSAADAGLTERPEGASLSLGAAILPHLRNRLARYYSSDLEPALGGVLQQWAIIDEAAQDTLRSLPLTGRERHPIGRLFGGDYQCQQVLEIAIVSRSEMARLLTMLLMLGLVRLSDEPLVPQADPADELRLRIAHAANADHFVRLGAHWTTHKHELARKYDRLSARYSSTSSLAQRFPDLCQSARTLLEECWAVIGKTTSRRSYRDSIVDETQRHNSAELLRLQGLTSEFRAGSDYAELDRAKIDYEAAMEIAPSAELAKAIRRVAVAAEAARLMSEAPP